MDGMLIVLIYAIIKGNGSSGLLNNYLKLNIAFLVLLNLHLPYNSMQNADLNKNAFNNAEELKCIDADSTFKISKEQNWRIEKNYFLKDELIIKINLCEIIDS
jgi:hypothetical protein